MIRSSAMIDLAARASAMKLPPLELDARGRGDDLLELMRLVEHDDVVLGQHAASGGEVHAVEVGVDHEYVGLRRFCPSPLGEARIADRTARCCPGIRAHSPTAPPRPRQTARRRGRLGRRWWFRCPTR